MPPPGAGPSAPRPPLRRRRDGRLLAGVLAGVADHLGLDVAVARILFVVLTVMTQGAFILAYILGWIFIPEETEAEAAAPRPSRGSDAGGRDPLFWVGIAILIVGVVWVLDGPFGGPGPFRIGGDRSVLVPLVLIAFGVALWRASDRTRHPAPPVMPPPEFTMSNRDPSAPGTPPGDVPADARTTQVIDPVGWGSPPAGPPPTAQRDGRDWTPPPVPTSRSVLTRVTLGVAVLTVGVLWLLEVADVVVLGPGVIFSAAMLVVGLGLLLGSVLGRGRGLIAAGLLLLPVVLLLQVVRPFPVDAFSSGGMTVGTTTETPADEGAVLDSYQVGAGELRLDLSDIEFTEDHDIAVQVGMGEIVVLLPEDVDVELVGRVGAGEMDLLDQHDEGVGLSRTVVDEVAGSTAELTIEVNVGFGTAEIDRRGGSFGMPPEPVPPVEPIEPIEPNEPLEP